MLILCHVFDLQIVHKMSTEGNGNSLDFGIVCTYVRPRLQPLGIILIRWLVTDYDSEERHIYCVNTLISCRQLFVRVRMISATSR